MQQFVTTSIHVGYSRDSEHFVLFLHAINTFKIIFRRWKSFPKHWEDYCSAGSSYF